MSGSAIRFLIAVTFNVIVAAGFHVFGASLATSWFTFLAFTGFAALAEIGSQLDAVARKLDAFTSLGGTGGLRG